MWKWLHPYANPEVSYRFVGKLLPWIAKITITYSLLALSGR
jgi:heme exporter protein C